jgi:hypothetical protein
MIYPASLVFTFQPANLKSRNATGRFCRDGGAPPSELGAPEIAAAETDGPDEVGHHDNGRAYNSKVWTSSSRRPRVMKLPAMETPRGPLRVLIHSSVCQPMD